MVGSLREVIVQVLRDFDEVKQIGPIADRIMAAIEPDGVVVGEMPSPSTHVLPIRAQAVEDVLSALTAHELYQYRPKAFQGFIQYARETLINGDNSGGEPKLISRDVHEALMDSQYVAGAKAGWNAAQLPGAEAKEKIAPLIRLEPGTLTALTKDATHE